MGSPPGHAITFGPRPRDTAGAPCDTAALKNPDEGQEPSSERGNDGSGDPRRLASESSVKESCKLWTHEIRGPGSCSAEILYPNLRPVGLSQYQSSSTLLSTQSGMCRIHTVGPSADWEALAFGRLRAPSGAFGQAPARAREREVLHHPEPGDLGRSRRH